MQAEHEQVGFGGDKVEVLVVDLGDLVGCAVLGRRGGNALEQRAGHRGQEADVGGLVEVLRRVGRDCGDVPGSGSDEVGDEHVRDGVASGVQVQVDGDAKVAQVLDAQHRRDDVAAQIVKDQRLPDGLAVAAEYT